MFSLALLAAALAAPPALAAKSLPGPAAAKRDAVHAGKTLAHRAKAKRPAARHAHRAGAKAPRIARAPVLPDAPMDLLPPPRLTPAFQLAPAPLPPRAACLAAARRAERIHGLPDGLLVAIAMSESGLHAHALNIGGRTAFPESAEEARALLAAAPQSAAVMAGCVQVNARVHARGSDWPLDAERSADWAGGLLRRWAVETGSWTTALARWHGGSPASTRRVLCRVRAKLEVTSPGSPVLADAGCAGSLARDRRNGEALLSVAEMPAR
ncbi:transglycosylase [Paracraurococcus lichenis]|uniref:Transglycosylase n=1 Tax=Paracraurococcus lichenis TaxID=3064888 RepID=A0ABT9DS89_9PROT|nr:transglycosylase [Paracraurococcus sp. LOR1-02]MDO9706753.1 transglycosylase [Paracraurococcus sp. LOR1-02]